MPPLARTHRSLPRTLAALASTIGVGWALAVAPGAAAATATPIVLTATDPAGDAYYSGAVDPGADITGFTLTQDRAGNVASGSVTFAGSPAAVPAGLHELRIALGIVDGSSCRVWETFGVVHIRHDLGTSIGDYIVGAMTDVRREFPFTESDTTVSFTTPTAPDVFGGYGYRCAIVTTERINPDRSTDSRRPQDTVMAFAPEDAPVKPSVPADPGNGVPAAIIDGDGDGVHDGIDKCPQVAGAATNGCESVPLAASIKLGTKRVVIDRLLASTSGACPSTVKIVVKLRGKTLGTGKAGTLKKGRYCHVLAVVKLKKRAKKARVTISGTGVAAVAATVAK